VRDPQVTVTVKKGAASRSKGNNKVRSPSFSFLFEPHHSQKIIWHIESPQDISPKKQDVGVCEREYRNIHRCDYPLTFRD